MRNRTNFSGKTSKRGRSVAKRKTGYQAKMSVFVYLTLYKVLHTIQKLYRKQQVVLK